MIPEMGRSTTKLAGRAERDRSSAAKKAAPAITYRFDGPGFVEYLLEALNAPPSGGGNRADVQSLLKEVLNGHLIRSNIVDPFSGGVPDVSEAINEAIEEICTNLKNCDDNEQAGEVYKRAIARFLQNARPIAQAKINARWAHQLENIANDVAIYSDEGLEYVSLQDYVEQLIREQLEERGRSEAVSSEFARFAVSQLRDTGLMAVVGDRKAAEAAASFAVASYEFYSRSAAISGKAELLSEGPVRPYLGKKRSGPIADFLRAVYPPRPGARPLSLQYLRTHDPKAVGAYNRLPDSEKADLGLRLETDASEDLLRSHRLDLTSEVGVDEAKRLYSLLQYRLYRKR